MKKAFTLVELLAVIVILAVILVIAVPKITSVIEGTRKSTIESTLNMIKKSAEKEYMNRSMLSTLDQENNPIGCSDVVNLSGTDYGSCKITFDNEGIASVTLYGKGKFDKYKCSNNECNTYTPVEVYQEPILNGAYPRLDEGMIPVKISNTGVVTTANPTTSDWYSYATNEKRWANVVLVKETATSGVTNSHSREFYKNSANYGTTIAESDILAYLVWIPRYNYTLWNVDGVETVYTDGVCTQNVEHTNCPRSITIEFEDANTTKKTGSTNGQKLTHPAFTYDVRELNGIWIGKFETSGTANIPTIKPHLSSGPSI